MPHIPQFYGIVVAPFLEIISLVLTQSLFLEGLRLIGNNSIKVGAGGNKGDNLASLILDNDSLR